MSTYRSTSELVAKCDWYRLTVDGDGTRTVWMRAQEVHLGDSKNRRTVKHDCLVIIPPGRKLGFAYAAENPAQFALIGGSAAYTVETEHDGVIHGDRRPGDSLSLEPTRELPMHAMVRPRCRLFCLTAGPGGAWVAGFDLRDLCHVVSPTVYVDHVEAQLCSVSEEDAQEAMTGFACAAEAQ